MPWYLIFVLILLSPLFAMDFITTHSSGHCCAIALQHTDPDYSCAYVVVETDAAGLTGHGLTFTCGRGTEVGLRDRSD